MTTGKHTDSGNGKFAPLEGEIKHYQVVGFDVEGTGERDGFQFGTIYDEHGPRLFTEVESMRRALLCHSYRNARIFAHNLEYDWGVLFQDITDRWTILRLRSNTIKMSYTDGRGHFWRFWDTANLSYFISLAALGEIIGLEKYPTPEWIKANGESTLSYDEYNEEQKAELQKYCIRDAQIVYEYAKFIQEEINEFGGKLHTTLPGTAMDIFRRRYLGRAYDTPLPWLNHLCRKGYYGGRTEVFQYGHGEGLYQYDVHSMYPAVMKDLDLPDPDTLTYISVHPKISYIENREGMTQCTVVAPEMHIPVLPTRIQKRLLFTTGKFSGVWCHNELRYALKQGYKIESIDWQIISFGTCNPFRGYVDDLYRRKINAQDAGNPAYFIYKLLLNGLYGKFGQKCDGALQTVEPIIDIDDQFAEPGQEILIWRDRHYLLKEVGGEDQPSYIIVMWAAYVTAAARIRLREMLSFYGKEVVYTDTDCVIGSREQSTGDGLGDLGLERGPTTFEFRAPKYYRWKDAEGQWNYKKAGVHRDWAEEFWHRGYTEYRSPTKLGESMRADKRMSVWIMRPKTDTARHFKRRVLEREWSYDHLIQTAPWDYDEAVSHYEFAPKVLPWHRGRFPSSRDTERAEELFIEDWQLSLEYAKLQEACTLPSSLVFKLWDYEKGIPKRVRNSVADLVSWTKSVVDEKATEHGYRDGESLMDAIREQVKIYERRREIVERRRILRDEKGGISDEVEVNTELPW